MRGKKGSMTLSFPSFHPYLSRLYLALYDNMCLLSGLGSNYIQFFPGMFSGTAVRSFACESASRLRPQGIMAPL